MQTYEAAMQDLLNAANSIAAQLEREGHAAAGGSAEGRVAQGAPG
jgi:hypothetical protein